ncbi:MAG: beta-Ala-His dipeptidase [Clostridia bacterium]|nr:beta-Ala-His dipeptidase [Clostridia bacterium]
MITENCTPKEVFSIFEEYCAVPHPSYHTEAATAFCLRFAEAHGLAATSDAAGNVVIRKPATAGKEHLPTVILQGHLDMVAEKEEGYEINFEKDGLSLFLEGDLLGARGTTLGGDNGIAVAVALAILADETLSHPALEVVLTTDEEVGMLGAEAMDMSTLRGKYLLNLDSEEEGVLTVSCAGGATATVECPAVRAPYVGNIITATLSGMRGGHSGVEIHHGRANASRLAAELALAAQGASPIRLLSIDGGQKDNAIPARAVCRFAAKDTQTALAACRAFAKEARTAYATADPDLTFTLEEAEGEAHAFSETDTEKVLTLLTDIPCGVQKMSADIAGLVQTSLNLGILQTTETGVRAVYSVRSSVGVEKDALREEIARCAARTAAGFAVSGAYPAWEYKKDCPLRETVLATHRRLYGKEMKVEAIHAGLECGLFSDRIKGLSCVSLGPNMQDIHTPRERLSVSSVKRTYEFVCEILKEIV